MYTSIPELYEVYLKHPLVSTDTRNLPQGCIFFALKGGNFNGNSFAPEALKQGAAFAIIDEAPDSPDPRMLLVEDVLAALQNLARHHREQLQIPVIGITGSNGKTTTKELVAAVLNGKFNTYFTKGNLNNHIGVPLTLLSINKTHEIAVVEMGANHQQEIAFLCTLSRPDSGLITNIGRAHLEGFGGPEGVKKGKGELYDFLTANNGLIFIRQEDAVLHEMLKGYRHTVSYGSSPDAACQGVVKSTGEYLAVNVLKPFQSLLSTHLTGNYNIDNVMAAVAIGMHYGVPPAAIKKAIESYQPGNQRSQVITKGSMQIILDAYNANPSSMQEAIGNLKTAFQGQKYIALGEMLELGDYAIIEHEKIGELLQNLHAEQVLLVGSNFEKVATKYNYQYFSDSAHASAWLKDHLPTAGTLLVKGSRGSKMEKILDAFT